MIKIDNDAYDDELFDSLIKRNENIQKKAKDLGLSLEEATSLIKEASGDSDLSMALNYLNRASRAYATSEQDKRLACDKIAVQMKAILSSGDEMQRPASGVFGRGM